MEVKVSRYEAPWAQVRGVFLCENVAVSYVPVIKNGIAEYYEFESFSDVQTQDASDVIVF
jgi:hypothetical protein